jgi:pimeloyl-ACP methyl ester carboxylesterase
MLLREAPKASDACCDVGVPVLIVAPFALHDASIGDFAVGHSIAETFAKAGLTKVALTQWKSATSEMRDFGIDRYFSDLTVAVDDLGGHVALVGLCQGGWLAAAFAARFPGKVRALVLAGAPIDLAAAPSQITASIASISPSMLSQTVRLGGGRLIGRLALPLWSHCFHHAFDARETLQSHCDTALIERAEAWNQ